MNVVKHGKRSNASNKMHYRLKNELVRKDSTIGIRGSISMLPTTHNIPRYQFNGGMGPSLSSRPSSMGPPSAPPRNLKRKVATSTSTKPESSSSGHQRPRVLALDSAAETSLDNMVTPRNRPNALRYISSSSRGGHSGNRSMRSTSNSVVEPSVILAISEGRGMARGEIGIAGIDLKHPNLVLCQFSDTLLYTHTLTKINYFNPVEIIVPHTFCEGVQPNQLYELIKNQFPHVNLTTVQRRHFNDAAGRQNIQTLCAPQYSAVYLQVLQKFYALTAAAAVLKYVEYIQCIVFARESLKIEYHSSEDTTIIDVGTATQLELVQPLVPSAGATCCLLGVLGPTFTVGGIRALRAAILQPSCNKEFIENRLDAVQELIENDTGLVTGLQDVIKKLCDIDKILFLCIDNPNQNMDKYGEAQLNQVLLLKTTMEMVPNLVETLSVAESGRLKKIKMDLENANYGEIAERIKTIIQDDAHLEKGAMGSLQRCFAVKPEINGLLDVARRMYSELIDDIQKIVEQLSENYDLPLRLNQNVMKGFHIVLPIAPKNRRYFNIEDLPPIFIQVHNNGANVSMTTEELVVLDQQSKESLNEIQKMSNIVICSLLKDLRPFMSSLYKLCEDVAELDILLALSQASSIGSYVRPEFSNYLDVRNSVHPLLDYNSQVEPVPNDIFASPEQNFTILTGPNMGGKSIYIKQIAVMQIMAQLGCFLPCTNAVLRLSDRIFSRIGFNDSVELNASTFVFEIKEIQHILKGITRSSLVVIDELCRATCSEEGISLAWAICEELMMSDAFTFFTTHFLYLTRLQELYFNVINRHTAVAEEFTEKDGTTQKKLIYRHKIELGVTEIEHYGLTLAAKTNLPKETIKLAKELAELIKRNESPQNITESEKTDEELLYHLNAIFQLEARRHNDHEEITKNILETFRKEHPQLVERLRVQISRNLNMPRNNIVSIESKSVDRESSNEVVTSDSPKMTNYQSLKNSQHNVTNTNYNAVKSSNELLIFMETDGATTASIIAPQNDATNPFDDEIVATPEFVTQNNEDIDFENKQNHIMIPASQEKYNVSSNNETFNVLNCSNRINNDENVLRTESIEEIFSDCDSDITEALTNILDDYSTDKEHNNNNSDHSNNDISADEDLIAETITEINEELQSSDSDEDDNNSIILTPPLDFRD